MARFRYERGEQPLEGYTVGHGLGVGGFGEVYFATSDSGREVALKAVQNYQEIELRGIRNCMNLKSPHLVTIFDVKHNRRGDPFVIMEYVNGPCLRTLLDNEPDGLGPTKAAFFLREIAKGLTYLHDAGVVHRDLKPHNVFYEEGYVKIGDYSLCKLISTSQHTGHTMTVGSVHYMAPEISQGRYNSSVDIYALGAMLYEMLTGSPPFTGESIGEVLMKQLNDEPNLSTVEEPFRSVIQRALAKNPDERYTSAADMVADIYGSQNIQNSVVAFNPQELTMVAGKVASQAEKIPAGGGGFGDRNSPVGFESGDASAWKRGGDSSTNLHGRITQDTDAPHNTVVSPKQTAAPSSWYQLDDQRDLAKDKMPVALRYFLGIGAAFTTAQMTALPWSRWHDGEKPESFTFVIICAAVFMICILRDKVLRRLSIYGSLLPRLLIIANACSIPLLLSVHPWGYSRSQWVGCVVAGLLPLAILNVHRLIHARRTWRFQLAPVAIAALIAVVWGSFFDFEQYYIVPIAIAAGTVMALQIVSPVRRIIPS